VRATALGDVDLLLDASSYMYTPVLVLPREKVLHRMQCGIWGPWAELL
jgi:hypothetical protein